MPIRISTTQLYNQATRRMMMNLRKVYDAQEDIATGKRVRRPQDNPAGFSRIVSTRSARAGVDQYRRNITFAQGFLAEAESALDSVSNVLARARELAMRGASGGQPEYAMDSLYKEVENVYEQLLSLANTRWSGGKETGERFIFAGFLNDTDAFASDGTYQGDAGEFEIDVGIGETVPIGLDGSRIFQGDVDIFATMRNLMTAFQNADSDTIGTALDDINRSIEQIATATSEVGMRVNRLESSDTRLMEMSNSLEIVEAQEGDLDIIEASSRLTRYQAALDAVIKSSQMIFQTVSIL